MVKVLTISLLWKTFRKARTQTFTYLEGKGKQKEEEKFVPAMKRKWKRKERKRHPKKSQKGWLVQVVWWMNEWMNVTQTKKIISAKPMNEWMWHKQKRSLVQRQWMNEWMNVTQTKKKITSAKGIVIHSL